MAETRTEARFPTNLELGYARAHAAEAALVAGGVPSERIEIVSRAASEPPAGGVNPRRIEILLDTCPGD